MDYLQMTAPCGLDCFNCDLFLAHENAEAMARVEEMSAANKIPVEKLLCNGCRDHQGRIPVLRAFMGETHHCAAYECSQGKGLKFCGDCDDFPCDNLHPYADMATRVPHNYKVFNSCLIKKMGLEKWAETKAAEVRKTYFTKPWTLG